MLMFVGTPLLPLLLPVAGTSGVSAGTPPAVAKPTSTAAAGCELPGPAPDVAPVAIARNGVNVASEHREKAARHNLEVCVLVDSLGIVREARVLRGGTEYDSAAVQAARWWLFEPARLAGRRVAARSQVTVEITLPADVDPLVPDVRALALDAEGRGDLRGAMDAWTGVLARVGAHPTLGDEWSVRERILRLAARITPRPKVPNSVEGRARGASNMMQRNIARGDNADYARMLDEALLVAPWFTDAYRWRAAARAASGQRPGAIRDVLCYEMAVRDSASRSRADQALRALAAGDTLAANSLLKH
jgi:hypothetical protein